MKKAWGRIIALIVIAAILYFAGIFTTDEAVVAPTDDVVVDDVAVATGDDEMAEDEEITAEDLQMIEDFLDEIVEAVEQEEAGQ
jgi:hypothetical protein